MFFLGQVFGPSFSKFLVLFPKIHRKLPSHRYRTSCLHGLISRVSSTTLVSMKAQWSVDFGDLWRSLEIFGDLWSLSIWICGIVPRWYQWYHRFFVAWNFPLCALPGVTPKTPRGRPPMAPCSLHGFAMPFWNHSCYLIRLFYFHSYLFHIYFTKHCFCCICCKGLVELRGAWILHTKTQLPMSRSGRCSRFCSWPSTFHGRGQKCHCRSLEHVELPWNFRGTSEAFWFSCQDISSVVMPQREWGRTLQKDETETCTSRAGIA